MQNEPTIILSGTDPDLPRKLPSGLGRYKGRRQIGRGGNGVLEGAFDPVTGRTVAIKMLPFDIHAVPNERRRLLREARVTAQLQHPNTVPVYEIGNDLVHGIYFTMKLISGENLFEILKRIATGDEATEKAYPAVRRVSALGGACQALAYAHARGVIHRDVKPENIWVGNFDEVYLLDWGTAKVWGSMDDQTVVRYDATALKKAEEEQQLQTLTGGGQRPGTPLYMSPEQIQGTRTIDERSDIFNAGVCLYELLAIREPFRGANIDQTFRNIIHAEVPPPSEKAPERNIPKLADEVVMRALKKRPAERYQTMRELIDAILDIVQLLDQD
ncbi:serine/threonine-protein kinase [Roseiconus lacunae]|uniref:Serine/threonine-protein kinase n=1 Tax=Roseiconus lacunae TaxID=2605694 RepID=A0ABT7PN84_9BACT|nr:serine/threonine-protein kinase [Roseiconus lacunae]MCD0462076.1 serine/threonine protein kinase [Roseiconus lacunae]MDM4017977.1 serine/threonine-protein kinase [Roseiconus lacunae]WRQ52450.1 serine/threonine-protein kinase [Stieleria sp. HD01]